MLDFNHVPLAQSGLLVIDARAQGIVTVCYVSFASKLAV